MPVRKGGRRADTTSRTGQAARPAPVAPAGDPSGPDRPTAGPPYRRLSDPRELQALAHPVRLGIMELLTVDGPLTATELADRLDETPANCSWHLRKLAEHAFVEEAGGGIGRQRPWRVTRIGLAWDEEGATPAQLRAGLALEEMLLQRQVARFQQTRAVLRDEPGAPWSDSSYSVQSAAWLTPDELEEIGEQVQALLVRYVGRLTDPAQRPAGSRLCEMVAWGAPLLLPGVEAIPAEGGEAAADIS